MGKELLPRSPSGFLSITLAGSDCVLLPTLVHSKRATEVSRLVLIRQRYSILGQAHGYLEGEHAHGLMQGEDGAGVGSRSGDTGIIQVFRAWTFSRPDPVVGTRL